MLKGTKRAAVALVALVVGYVVVTGAVGALFGVLDALMGTTFGTTQAAFAIAGVLGLVGAYTAARRAAARV